MAKVIRSIESQAREHSETAIATIADLMESADPKVALAAAREILDRGHGKPIGVTVMVPGTSQQRARLAAMSDDDLMEVLEAEAEPLPQLPPPSQSDDAPTQLPEIEADPLFN